MEQEISFKNSGDIIVMMSDGLPEAENADKEMVGYERTEEIKKIGLSQVQIFELWFQQYGKGDTHGWHVHGHNFTGVYYLEFGKNSPKTQIVEPLSLKIIDVDVKQGDVIIFPSMFIHRAPPSCS